MLKRILPVAVLPVMICSTGGAAAQSGNPSQDAAWYNRQILALVERDLSTGWQVLPSGLRWRRTEGDGSGQHPVATDTVTIHYSGKFIDGIEFDSSFARGKPATFLLGRLIKGWQEALPLAGVGDVIEIAIPAELAYGPRGKGPIPGGATLLFTIKLLGIERDVPQN